MALCARLAAMVLAFASLTPSFAGVVSVTAIEPPLKVTDADTRVIFSLSEAALARLHDAGLTNTRLVQMGPAMVAKTIEKMDRAGDEDVRQDQPGEAMHWRHMQRADANGVIAPGALLAAKAERDAMLAAQAPIEAATPIWEWLGPGNIGGRTRSILIDPTNPSIMYAGSVGGGVWKSTNAGGAWAPLTDFIASIAVSSMAMDPNDPNTFYVGTGEGYFNADSIVGAGIFKTTDAGATFTQLPSTANSNFNAVNRISFAPGSSTTMLVATGNGIYRSTDAGQIFTLVKSGRTLDVDFSRTDPNIAVAGTDSVVRWSNDGGLNWTNAVLPGGSAGRIEVAIAPSDPTIVYASSQKLGLFGSTDGGHTFVNVAGQFYMSSQGWYDNIVWVDPTDPSTVVVGGLDLHRSRDAGFTWTKISAWQFAPSSAHADHHMIVEDPGFDGVTNKTVYFGDDGGLYRATDVYTVAEVSGWQELNNNYGVTQFYGGSGNSLGTSGRLVGGTQDNGTLTYFGGTETWNTMFGGDGGYGAADQAQLGFFYGETQWAGIHRSSDSGVSSTFIFSPGLVDAQQGSTNFISPFILDPNGYNTLYVGAARLWRTASARTEAGFGWTVVHQDVGSNHSAIAVANGDPNILWVGHNNGNVYVTTNASNASPTWTRVDTNGLPNRFVTSITIDPSNHNRVWVTFSGFSSDNVWLTSNGGATWAAQSGAGVTKLPALPVNSLTLDQVAPGRVFVGTDLGVFVSEDNGSTWTTSNIGPANTVVDQVFPVTMGGSPYVVAATHGRGMYRMLLQPNPADLNGDGVVNGVDLSIVLNAFGTPNADLTGDGNTDGADIAFILNSWTG